MGNRGCGCKSPTDRRIGANGHIEQSFDNGATWETDRDDGRFNAPIFPPLVGPPIGTMRCAGAKSGTEVQRILIDRIKNDSDVWNTVLSIIAAIVSFLAGFMGPVAAPVAVVITALAYVMWLLTQAAFQAENWDASLEIYKCILYCRMSGDVKFTETAWNNVKADIVEKMSGFSETFFWNTVQGLGPAGLTNTCRVFPGLAGDCDCACDCSAVTLGETFGKNLLSRPDLGVGWWQVTTTFDPDQPNCDNGCYFAEISIPACCLHNAYEIQPPGTNAPPGNRQAVDCNGNSGFANYGLGGCQVAIAFRSYEEAIFHFQILECP